MYIFHYWKGGGGDGWKTPKLLFIDVFFSVMPGCEEISPQKYFTIINEKNSGEKMPQELKFKENIF